MVDILGELVLRIRGDSSSATDAMSKTKQGMQGLLAPANLIKGAVIGAGLAINKLANEVIPLNQTLDRTAQMTGVASDELRKLVVSVAQVDRPVQQVVDTFEFLAERGIHSAESLGRLTPILDTIADALGSNIPAVAEKADRFLGAFGMTLEDLDEQTAGTIYALEKLTREGLQPMSMVARQFGPQMREMGMDLSETATIMLALDRNTGSSREAITYMRQAMATAGGDLGAFKAAIEETTGPLDEYAKMIDGGTEMLDEHAAINIRHFTLWDKMKHQWTEMKFALGGHLENMREYGMATAGIVPLLGPMGRGLGSIKQGFVGLKGATLGALGPWLLIAAAVTALILVFKHLWETNEEFRDKVLAVWERIKGVLLTTWEIIKTTAEVVFGYLRVFWERWGESILATALVIWDLIANTIETALTVISGVIQFFAALFRGDWTAAWEAIRDVAVAIWDWIKTTAETVFGGLRDTIARVWDSILSRLRSFGERVRKLVDWFIDPVKKAVGWFKRLFGIEDEVPPEVEVTRPAPVYIPGETAEDLLPTFAEGGVVPGHPNQAVPIIAHGGELVVPADETRTWIDRIRDTRADWGFSLSESMRGLMEQVKTPQTKAFLAREAGISATTWLFSDKSGIKIPTPWLKQLLPAIQTALSLLGNRALNVVSGVAQSPMGMLTEFVDEAAQLVQGLVSMSREPALQAVGPSIPEFRYGGVVPGYPGQPQVILAHGGEHITPGTAPNNIFNFTFHGSNPFVRGNEREVRRLAKMFANEITRDLVGRGVTP